MSLTGKDLVALYKKQPVGISCGLVSLGLIVFMFAIRSGAEDEARKLLKEKQDEANRLVANNTDAKNLDKETSALTDLNKAVHDRAVVARDLSLNYKYFYEIEDAAKVKNLNTAQTGIVQPSGKAPPKTNYVPVAYKVSVQGDFAQIVDLLRRLEQGSRFARVMDARLAPSAREGPEASKLTLVLTLELLGLPSAP
jgi:hypothetical protein